MRNRIARSDLGLEPADDSGQFGLALTGPGGQNDLAANAILGFEEHHPVASLGKNTSCLETCGASADDQRFLLRSAR